MCASVVARQMMFSSAEMAHDSVLMGFLTAHRLFGSKQSSQHDVMMSHSILHSLVKL